MCLLRCTTRHAKLGHAKKKPFQPMQPKHWAEQGEDLGPATNLRVQKHNWERKLQTDAGKRLTDPEETGAQGQSQGLGFCSKTIVKERPPRVGGPSWECFRRDSSFVHKQRRP